MKLKFLAGALASALFVFADAPLAEAPQVADGSELGVGRLVANLEFAPAKGKKFRLADNKPAPLTVIAFTSSTCPVAKRYVPTLAALEKEFGACGVKFIYVNPIATDPVAASAIPDAKRRITAALGARSTTEVFVVDAGRTLLYRGAIDDQYGLGYSRGEPQYRYLVEALNAALKGESPAVAATTAPGCVLETKSPVASKIPLTYHARVSRIVQEHCVECHRAGGVAPFSLETYADVTSHAGMIRKQVEKGVMPPWFASKTHGGISPWSNDRELPPSDKADLVSWLTNGSKEGNRADAPLPKKFPHEWAIGTPDMIVQIPEPIDVVATGVMPYQNVLVETKFTEARWVRAMEMRPTAREVVHHALVYVVPPERLERARKRGGGDTEGGNFFGVYVPGNNALIFPEGFAKLIPAGAWLHFQIHYTPNGTATRDQTRLGMIFAKETPRHEVRVAAVPAKLDIPPGDPNYEASGFLPVPFDAKILSFMPHMHVRGKAYRYELESPGQTNRVLLDVPRYDFNWQLQYRLREPIDAPAGSRLLGTAWYDNSTNNPANPDPTARVKWGQQTFEEMMLGYFEYYVPAAKPGVEQTSIAEMALRDGGLIFMGLDKNRDGKLTIEESPAPQQFRDADADKDGFVTRDEFKVFWQAQRAKRNR